MDHGYESAMSRRRSLREAGGAIFYHSDLFHIYTCCLSLKIDRSLELGEFLAFDSRQPLERPMEIVLSTRFTALAVVNVDDFPVIRFSHFSVKTFLTSLEKKKKSDIISARYHVSVTSAHGLIVQAYLRILSHLEKK